MGPRWRVCMGCIPLPRPQCPDNHMRKCSESSPWGRATGDIARSCAPVESRRPVESAPNGVAATSGKPGSPALFVQCPPMALSPERGRMLPTMLRMHMDLMRTPVHLPSCPTWSRMATIVLPVPISRPAPSGTSQWGMMPALVAPVAFGHLCELCLCCRV
jgi:hypothetical protein